MWATGITSLGTFLAHEGGLLGKIWLRGHIVQVLYCFSSLSPTPQNENSGDDGEASEKTTDDDARELRRAESLFNKLRVSAKFDN